MEPTPQESDSVSLPLASGTAVPLALSVLVPAYNEAARLGRTLAQTTDYLESRGALYEILVVDDGSSDDTVGVVRRFASERPTSSVGHIQALRYDDNRGKGHAVRYGILRADGDRVLYMDADLATPIEEIVNLEAALDGDTAGPAQVAIGSRPLRESTLLIRQPWYREMAGRAFNMAVQTMATPGILDTQCGFKLMTRTAAREIFSRCTLNGFSFDVEMLFVARRLGYTIAEVPVRWAHQEGAAAFATRGAYLRHGLRMLADLGRIRWIHRAVHPLSLNSTAAAPTSTVLPPT